MKASSKEQLQLTISGDFRYEASFGCRSLEDAKATEPLEKDAVLWIASCTKLMTSVAVMQCVEMGYLNLEDDASTIIYEFKDIDILTGFDTDGNPQFRKPTRKITLRLVILLNCRMALYGTR